MAADLPQVPDRSELLRDRRVLVVEDDPTVREVTCDYLRNAGFIVDEAADGIAAFYDTVIGPNVVRFAIRESYACGHEVANVGTITTTLPDGARAIVEGVYTYRVNDEGRILALRAFWEADAITFEPPPT